MIDTGFWCGQNPAMKTRLLVWLLAIPHVLANAAAPLPIDLPDGLVAEVAAAPPLVAHPIMATLGEPGKLFVGDAPGLNLNKAELEKQLPNRVVLLHDTNGDGIYDRATVFADKMTFPQGGVWLDGSLYVASPPGIWKLMTVRSPSARIAFSSWSPLSWPLR